MMRTFLILSLVLVVALSFGCSKKKEQAPAPTTEQTTAQPDTMKPGQVIGTIDPVSKQEVDPNTEFKYEYNGIIYVFQSAENLAAFKADPNKYLTAK
jgi:YHS domain-containing protein